MNKKPLKFFILVFIISIPFWLIGAFTGQLSRMLPINLPVSALIFICPLLATLILTRGEKSFRISVKNLFRSVFDYARISNKIWYLPAFLLVPLIYFLSYEAMRLMELPLPDPKIPFLLAPVFFMAFFFFAACEEIGWSGYAIDPMQNQWGSLQSSIILGFVWQIWHIIGDVQAHNTTTWIIWHSLYSIALRILIVWIYNNTKKSVFIATLVHTMDNVSWALFPNYGSGYDPFYTCVIAWVTAVFVIFLWGPDTLARYRYAQLSMSDTN